MIKITHGRVRGNTIELIEDLGLDEGQEVEVQISIVPRASNTAPAVQKWGDGIRRTAGALADDPNWDAIMDEIHQSRKVDRASEAPDL